MKILYFYPENPLLLSQGNHARALALLHYFQDRNIEVDFVSENFNDKNTLLKNEQLISEKLVANHFFIRKFEKKKTKLKYFFRYSLLNKIFRKLKRFNNVMPGQQNDFNEILKKNSYDFIVISYASWASLIYKNKHLKNAKLVVDTHDFLTSQFKNSKNFKLGKFFSTEIKLLQLFDKIIVISTEEKYLFSQFLNNEVEIISHPLVSNHFQSINKEYDIIYIASNNTHNVTGVKWFFNNVYPLLNKSMKIMVIGGICKEISEYENVTKIDFAANLYNYYTNSKIAICPMFSGTGLKIKVIEAMSFGLPIVCNERAVDGLLNKTNNGCLVTNDKQEFADYIHKLLVDEDFYSEISFQSKKYFTDNNDIQSTYKSIDKIFNFN